MAPPFELVGFVSSLILVVLAIVWVRQQRLSRRARFWGFVTALVVMAGYIGWLAGTLYALWHQNPDCPICQYSLPPHSTYWARETFGRYGAYFGVNIATGLLFGLGFWVIARRTKGEVIDGDDVFLLTLAGLMIGWPNILLFLVALFVLAVIVFLIKRGFRDRVMNPRVIITPLIPFAALPIILWGDWLAARLGFYDLGLVAITLFKP